MAVTLKPRKAEEVQVYKPPTPTVSKTTTTPKPSTTTTKPATTTTTAKPATTTTVKTTGTGTAPNAAIAKPVTQTPVAQTTQAPTSYQAPIYDVSGANIGNATVMNGVAYTQTPQGNWVPVKETYGNVQWNPATKSIITTGITPQQPNQPMSAPNLMQDPNMQQFFDQLAGMQEQYTTAMQNLQAQQNMMTPEQYYQLAAQYLKPQYDTATAQLQQQLNQLNQEAGVSAEARGLSSSMLEDVSKSRNAQVFGQGLADLMGQYMAGTSQAGGQDYNTAVQKLSNMAAQMGNTFQSTTGAMRDLTNQYLDAWKNKGTLTQGQSALDLQKQQLADDKWYKTEVLKDADAQLALDKIIAQNDMTMRAKELAIRQQAQLESKDPNAAYNAYVTVLSSAQEAMKTGDFSVAKNIINQSPLTSSQKAELIDMVDNTRRVIAYTAQTKATSGATNYIPSTSSSTGSSSDITRAEKR